MYKNFNDYIRYLKINETFDKPDQVDKEAKNKIRRCVTQLITNYGFFAEILFNLNVMEVHETHEKLIPTMATDGKSIVYNKNFVKKLTESEVVFVLIHEILHVANFHFLRQDNRDSDLWNRAADYAINIMIDDMKNELNTEIISPPKNILLDSKYRNMGAEEIYDLLPKQNKKGGGKGSGSGSGSGSNTLDDDIMSPGSLDGKGNVIYKGNPNVSGAKNDEELKDIIKDIRNNAALRHRGSGSASIDRWLRKLNKPKINWKSELKKFTTLVFTELDYKYPNKRHLWKDEYLPGAHLMDKSEYQDVVIAIDTSGSISDDLLGEFASELKGIFKLYNINYCHVIWCDSEILPPVQTFRNVNKGFNLEKLHPKGGGGTSFKPPFKWIQENIIKKRKELAFFIYFTDAEGSAPNTGEYNIRKYINRILWVISNNDEANNIKFGKKLFIS